jgi:hypothetical protein
MFHNFRQALGLSVLALVSMMIGATIIHSPMHDLRFKKSMSTNEIITNKISSHNIVLKVNTPQLQRSPRKRNVSQRLPFPVYQPPRRLSFSQTHFCLT